MVKSGTICRHSEIWFWIVNLEAFSLDVFGSGALFSMTSCTCRRSTPLAALISVITISEGFLNGG